MSAHSRSRQASCAKRLSRSVISVIRPGFYTGTTHHGHRPLGGSLQPVEPHRRLVVRGRVDALGDLPLVPRVVVEVGGEAPLDPEPRADVHALARLPLRLEHHQARPELRQILATSLVNTKESFQRSGVAVMRARILAFFEKSQVIFSSFRCTLNAKYSGKLSKMSVAIRGVKAITVVLHFLTVVARII